MRVVFIGPPGAGKGTQAVRVAEHLGVKQLSTGDVLRQARDRHEPIGLEAGKYLDKGHLVPDAMVVAIVSDRLAKDDCAKGYLFDGFPRTLGQAEALDDLLVDCGAPLDAAIEFVVPEDELFNRLHDRGRSDDSEATIRERLRHYAVLTAPLAEYYDNRGVLRCVDAVGTPDEVFKRVCDALDDIRAKAAKR
ncbi:adenylate kinase [Botrimarina mediterranea]|uniref:Adenylate kinase n=1 Tax=Botrimarina mediterranea TaxID=2528022 RepID=A0A518KEL7_9BACT|nr:adenylate kinase [Botrimarina mediterranea]QDV76223.1 Adenylate kinase [Botrimarina mediterranea]QDV80821.1 Adenylate kinase [Planctomycetes bacterium K2D]